ncbi:MAG: hypothetical protein CO017_07785, partial [Zetaproteobacteria bacterium CG_4_8_14_3_um_filter_59_5]
MCPATGCLLLNHAGHGADLMSKSIVRALKCRECGQEYPIEPTHVCEYCFGPLEVAYDYDKLKGKFTRELIESRPQTMWRYKELLPIDG